MTCAVRDKNNRGSPGAFPRGPRLSLDMLGIVTWKLQYSADRVMDLDA